MAASTKKKVGELVKEARTNAKLTQAQLAEKVDGVSASDISKCERGEKDLPQAALKQIAKATGVTQKSLLEAAPNTAASPAKTSASAKTSTSAAKKTSSTSAAKTASTAAAGEKLTAAEKRVLELYRAADSATKKNAEAVLKGTKKVAEDNILADTLADGVIGLLSNLGKK